MQLCKLCTCLCCVVYVCIAVSPTDFLKLLFPLCLHIHPQTHRMLQRSTVLSSVRCFKSSMDTRPLSVWTGQGTTTPCLTVIGYREVSDINIAHLSDLIFFVFYRTNIRDNQQKYTGIGYIIMGWGWCVVRFLAPVHSTGKKCMQMLCVLQGYNVTVQFRIHNSSNKLVTS